MYIERERWTGIDGFATDRYISQERREKEIHKSR